MGILPFLEQRPTIHLELVISAQIEIDENLRLPAIQHRTILSLLLQAAVFPLGPKILSWNLNDAESEGRFRTRENKEIRSTRKFRACTHYVHFEKLNPHKNTKVTATRLHVDIRMKSKTISMRKPYSSILITQTPVGIQQDYTSKS